ncbi:TPA: DUF2737 family protein [Escherichia coli]|nr:DUF2737 family protein [Escherichia coli]
MRGLAYNPGILPAEMIIRQRVKPMPNAMWRKGGNQ